MCVFSKMQTAQKWSVCWKTAKCVCVCVLCTSGKTCRSWRQTFEFQSKVVRVVQYQIPCVVRLIVRVKCKGWRKHEDGKFSIDQCCPVHLESVKWIWNGGHTGLLLRIVLFLFWIIVLRVLSYEEILLCNTMNSAWRSHSQQIGINLNDLLLSTSSTKHRWSKICTWKFLRLPIKWVCCEYGVLFVFSLQALWDSCALRHQFVPLLANER